MQWKKAGRRARVRPGILAAMIALAALTGAAAPPGGHAAAARVRPAASLGGHAAGARVRPAVPLGGHAAAARVRPAAPQVRSGSSSAGTPVPAAFRAQSITWATPRSGWLLGTVPCRASTCTAVIGTADGAHWALLGRVRAPIAPSGEPGVTEIRMATPKAGWVFGPGLLRTADGGRSWRPETIPGGGRQVLDLAATAQAAYAVVSPCAVGKPCHRSLSVWRTARLQRPAWHRVPISLPPSFAAVVAIGGGTVYLIDPQPYPAPDAFYASVGGGRFTKRPVPCQKRLDGNLVDVAPVTSSRVALLCVIDPGFGSAEKTVFRSADTGRTDQHAGQTPIPGISSEIAATRGGTLAVASSASRGSFVYRNAGGTRWTTPLPRPDDGGALWNDLVFSTSRVGWVVYGPVNFSDLGVVYRTADGGRSWHAFDIAGSG